MFVFVFITRIDFIVRTHFKPKNCNAHIVLPRHYRSALFLLNRRRTEILLGFKQTKCRVVTGCGSVSCVLEVFLDDLTHRFVDFAVFSWLFSTKSMHHI